MSQRDVKTRIGSVKNIQKITRAMEMVAAARLRRAEQRVEALRPYAGAIRRMTRQAIEASGGSDIASLPLLQPHAEEKTVALLLVTADRGLAGAFNSQIVRAGLRAAAELESRNRNVVFWATGRRGVSSLTFRKHEPARSYTGFSDRPTYTNAREIAEHAMADYLDQKIDRIEIFYNGYVSPLVQEVRRETLIPFSKDDVIEGTDHDHHDGAQEPTGHSPLVAYEPSPEQILKKLVPDYTEISVYRALLESTASEHGARMTAMRSASENAGEIIEQLTLEMNRARQAEITQEIMEVVAGAESLT